MKLIELQIKNFGCIDENGITIKIDDIVVLIGPNNVGKTTSIGKMAARLARDGKRSDYSENERLRLQNYEAAYDTLRYYSGGGLFLLQRNLF